MKILQSILLFLLISSSFCYSEMMEKLQKSSSFSDAKIQAMAIIGDLLLSEKYEPAFVAGVLGNINHEGDIGMFESSNYATHPELKPQYLKYMDDLYNYDTKYSGKCITDVSLDAVYKLLKELKGDNWEKGKFGLGCVQWTGGRAYNLVETYKAECENCDKITLEKAIAGEGKMIIKEFKGNFVKVYNSWKSQNISKNTPNAAYNAGVIVCKNYDVPADTENEAQKRGNTAANIYNIITT